MGTPATTPVHTLKCAVDSLELDDYRSLLTTGSKAVGHKPLLICVDRRCAV